MATYFIRKSGKACIKPIKTKNIIADLFKPLSFAARIIGISNESLSTINEPPKVTKISAKIKKTLMYRILSGINLALHLTTIILIAVLLHALWKNPNKKEVLHFLTFVEINVATIAQGFICFMSLTIRINKYNQHLASFVKLNPLLESFDDPTKKISSWFICGLAVAFIIQTGSWIAMITANYPDDHPTLASSPNKWMILGVIYIGIISIMISQYLLQASYLILVHVIGVGFQSIGNKMELALTSVTTSTSDNDAWLCRRLFKIRQQYQMCTELAWENDQIISPSVFTGLLANTVITAVTLYQMFVNLIYESKILGGLTLGATGLMSGFWITALCIVPHSAVTKASEALISVFSTPMPNHLPASHNELKIIAIKISGPPMAFTASEFITLNRSSFTQIASICITYIVGMLQFRQDQ